MTDKQSEVLNLLQEAGTLCGILRDEWRGCRATLEFARAGRISRLRGRAHRRLLRRERACRAALDETAGR